VCKNEPVTGNSQSQQKRMENKMSKNNNPEDNWGEPGEWGEDPEQVGEDDGDTDD